MPFTKQTNAPIGCLEREGLLLIFAFSFPITTTHQIPKTKLSALPMINPWKKTSADLICPLWNEPKQLRLPLNILRGLAPRHCVTSYDNFWPWTEMLGPELASGILMPQSRNSLYTPVSAVTGQGPEVSTWGSWNTRLWDIQTNKQTNKQKLRVTWAGLPSVESWTGEQVSQS